MSFSFVVFIILLYSGYSEVVKLNNVSTKGIISPKIGIYKRVDHELAIAKSTTIKTDATTPIVLNLLL